MWMLGPGLAIHCLTIVRVEGAWARNGGVGKKWGSLQLPTDGRESGIETDESQSGGIGVWEHWDSEFPPSPHFRVRFGGEMRGGRCARNGWD